MYIKCGRKIIEGKLAGKPLDAAKAQSAGGIGGNQVSLNGSKFFVLKAEIFTANFHLPASLGMMSLGTLQNYFKDKD